MASNNNTSIDPNASGQQFEEADSKLLSEIIKKAKGTTSTKW